MIVVKKDTDYRCVAVQKKLASEGRFRNTGCPQHTHSSDSAMNGRCFRECGLLSGQSTDG